jgi:hypothetical protein
VRTSVFSNLVMLDLLLCISIGEEKHIASMNWMICMTVVGAEPPRRALQEGQRTTRNHAATEEEQIRQCRPPAVDAPGRGCRRRGAARQRRHHPRCARDSPQHALRRKSSARSRWPPPATALTPPHELRGGPPSAEPRRASPRRAAPTPAAAAPGHLPPAAVPSRCAASPLGESNAGLLGRGRDVGWIT